MREKLYNERETMMRRKLCDQRERNCVMREKVRGREKKMSVYVRRKIG